MRSLRTRNTFNLSVSRCSFDNGDRYRAQCGGIFAAEEPIDLVLNPQFRKRGDRNEDHYCEVSGDNFADPQAGFRDKEGKENIGK